MTVLIRHRRRANVNAEEAGLAAAGARHNEVSTQLRKVEEMLNKMLRHVSWSAIVLGASLIGLGTTPDGPARAQTIPLDPSPTCTVPATIFASWFQSGTPTLNGVVNPANSVAFPDSPNCSFYQWSEQMF